MFVIKSNMDLRGTGGELNVDLEIEHIEKFMFNVVLLGSSESKHEGGFAWFEIDLKSKSSEVTMKDRENDFRFIDNGGVVVDNNAKGQIICIRCITEQRRMIEVFSAAAFQCARPGPREF